MSCERDCSSQLYWFGLKFLLFQHIRKLCRGNMTSLPRCIKRELQWRVIFRGVFLRIYFVLRSISQSLVSVSGSLAELKEVGQVTGYSIKKIF